MRANTSEVFVIDVESTCWETPELQGEKPNEVIEIGICRLNMKSGAVTDVSSYLIKPQRSEISAFCTQLTGWKTEDFVDASDMRTTLRAIGQDYGMSRDHVWFSFGEYDRVKLSSNHGEKGGLHHLYGIERHDNPIAQLRSHFNIKTLMMLKERLAKGLGMDRALQFYGLTLDGRHHNGADDAANIAKIVHRVLS